MALGKNLSTSKSSEEAVVSDEKKGNPVSETKDEMNSAPEVAELEEQTTNVSYEQYCVFSTGSEEYAFPIHLVKEVVPYPQVAFVPQMPKYIKGMANVRGNIYGILDLNTFFKIKRGEGDDYKYLLVIDSDSFQMSIAIPEVPNTLMVSDSMIEKLSSSRLKSTRGQKYLKGIIKKDGRMIILFDILGMISSDDFTVVT